MSFKRVDTLVRMMSVSERDFTLDEIYRITCRPPHQFTLTVQEMHSRTSRYIGHTKVELKKLGFVLVPGALRHSYKAVKRTRGKV